MSTIIVGSRSPRRLEILERIVDADRIAVLQPLTDEEAGFEQLHNWPAIESRLLEIARDKQADVLKQLQTTAKCTDWAAVVTADTIIVAGDVENELVVLGQPPDDPDWADTVRHWFRKHLAGKTHVAATGLCVTNSAGREAERVVKSTVTFHDDAERWLDWYLRTEEPRGKAGGYGLQGAGDLFVSQVTGSLSNVIGLPLRDLMELFEELQIDIG